MKTLIGFALALSLSFAGALSARAADDDFGEKGVAIIEKLAVVVDTNKADCDKMGDGVEKFVVDNSASIKEINTKSKSLTPEQQEAFKKKYGPRLDAAMQKTMGGAEKCHDNKKATDAFQHLMAAFS